MLSDAPVYELIKNLGPSSKFGVEPDEFDDAGRLNPLFALTYAVARKNGAKDWLHGIAIGKDSVGDADKVEIHHIFPKKVLKDMKVSKKDRDEIANLAFLARRPNEFISSNPPDVYLPEIAQKHPERLKDQYVPLEPRLWKPENFQAFLAERRRLLANAVNDLVADTPTSGGSRRDRYCHSTTTVECSRPGGPDGGGDLVRSRRSPSACARCPPTRP